MRRALKIREDNQHPELPATIRKLSQLSGLLGRDTEAEVLADLAARLEEQTVNA